MKWSEAIAKIDKPTLSNREASGLISFARAAFNLYSKTQYLDPFDWYGWTLAALGWTKAGDKFAVDTAHQLAAFPRAAELRAALGQLAAQLDGHDLPFRAVVDPRGTDKGFRQLAKDAWAVMRRAADMPISAEMPLSANTPRKRARVALGERIADAAHARWFIYAENKDGTWITAEAADETKARAMFDQLSSLDTSAYAAYWDTTKQKLKPAQEFAGAIQVAPDGDDKPSNGKRVGVAAGGFALLALLVLAASKKRGAR